MAILVDKATKVICQGITGSQRDIRIVSACAAKITDEVKK